MQKEICFFDIAFKKKMGTKKININLKGLSIREINFRELTTENKKEKIEKEEKDSPLLSSNNMEVKEDSSSTSTNPVQEREKTPEQGKRFSITGLFERIQEQDDYGYDSEDSFIDDSEISVNYLLNILVFFFLKIFAHLKRN